MRIIDRKCNCLFLESVLIEDNRGWFQIPVNFQKLEELGIDFERVCQINHSYTREKGVVRGPNYQCRSYNQAKIVRVLSGSVFSVAICIDKTSEFYDHACGFYLSA